MCGMLAFSKAGHDKGRLYMVIDQDETYCYLCDGRLKTTGGPKKKKYKHIQIVKKISDEIKECIEKGRIPDDIMIRKVIKDFEKRQV